jgi:hypothetical protein
MRGAERPAKVRWTRPFLEPLKPLTWEAARQTFFAIAEDDHDSKDVDKLLSLTDNLPLAIDLIAHLVDYEGCSETLARWDTERTSLLSDGYDRRSNLDLSISLSLSSPRVMSSPHAQELLSLLSVLPDGLSDVELLHSNLPIGDIFGCKTALLRTSLAYADSQGRLKVMVPIREYMQKFHPAMDHLVHSLLQYFQELMRVNKRSFGTRSGHAIGPRIRVNFANIQNLVLDGLRPGMPDLVDSIYCAFSLETFSRLTSHHCTGFRAQILGLLPQLSNPELEVTVITEMFECWREAPVPQPELLVKRALQHICHVEDLDIQGIPFI